MPKRRRLFTPLKNKTKSPISKAESDSKDVLSDNIKNKSPVKDVTSARGRLQGAIMDVLDPPVEESQSDTSSEDMPVANERQDKNYQSEDEDPKQNRHSYQRQSYVLKLFDRSVDLSQFDEDTPLYPICRAWIANQPKTDYSEFGKKAIEPEISLNAVELPGPEGPLVSRIPALLPQQLEVSEDILNQMHQTPAPSREQLLQAHMSRWVAVRQAWIEQANRVESRYESSQQCLNKISISGI